MTGTHRGIYKENSAPLAETLSLEAPPRFELGNEAFAELCLTTWLWCRIYYIDCASALCYSTPFAFCCRLERETRYSLPAAHSCKALSATAKACPADCAELAMRQMSRALLYHFNAVCVLLLVGARDEIRTRDICLGKATLYH